MSHVLRIGVPDQIAYFRAFNDDGSAKTDFSSATAGASLSVFRAGLSPISIAVLSDKATDNTSHADGALRAVGGNLYTVDLPDSAAASYCPSIGVRGSFTGGVIEPVPHPLVGYAPETLLSDISGLIEDVTVLAESPISSGDTTQVQIDSPTGVFSLVTNSALKDCLVEIQDISTGNSCLRWVASHSLLGGTGSVILTFDSGLAFIPVAGDIVRVFHAARFTANVTRWNGTTPASLVGGGQVAAYDANANALLNNVPTVAQLDAQTNTINNYTLTNVIAVDTYQNALDAKNAINSLGSRIPAALVSGKMSSYIDPADRSGYSLAADQPVNVTKVGGTSVSGPDDLKADVSGLSTFNAATDAVALQPDQGVNIVKVAGATAIASDSTVNFPLAIGNSFLSPVNVGQVLFDYGAAKTSDVTGIPAAVWSHASRTLSAFGFSVTVGTNNDKTGYSLSQVFPSNFASLGINPSGHVSRVTLVDTTTANSDMRGTDGALLAGNYTAPANSDIAAIKAKTDNLPANPAAVGDVSPTINFSPTIEPTTLDSAERGAIAAAVRSELNTELSRIDVAVSSRSTFAGGAVASVTAPVTVGSNNDKSGYSLTQAFPTNFASLGINPAGHVSRVTLVDTTTTNTDMRGTDGALLAADYTPPPTEFEGATAAEIWQYPDRTLTSEQTEVVIDVEALAEEIADALTSSGLYRLTIDVVDQDSDAVPGTRLQILGVAGTTRTIGADGKATIDLDTGTYTLRVTPPSGYAPVADREVVITDADVTEQVELASLFPSVAPLPGTCALTIQVADQSGAPLADVPVSGQLPKGYLVNVDTLNLNTLTHQTTDPQGLATLILIRDQPYDLTAQRPDRGVVTLRIHVPDAEQSTLSQVFQL